MKPPVLPAAVCAALALAGCAYPYPVYQEPAPYVEPDAVTAGLVGAGLGAVAGAAIVAASQPRHYGWGPSGWGYYEWAPRPHPRWGWGGPGFRPPPGWARPYRYRRW